MAALENSRSPARHHSGHHHHHDTTYLTSANKNDAAVRITRIGLFVNVGMALSKGIGGYVFESKALSADAIHSFTDLISDFMTLASVSWALKPPTKRFPLGYGKVESLGSLGVSGLLLAGGVLMGWSSIIDLCHIYLPAVAEIGEQLHIFGHSHSHSHSIPNIQAAWLAGGSVLAKEWLYRATMKVARERKSSVLESNAVHHRVDSLTGIAALVAIVVSNIVPTLAAVDALGGLLISWLVVKAGFGNTRTALVELADAGIDEEVKAKVQRAAAKAIEGLSLDNVQVRQAQGIKAGQNYLVELDVSVPYDWPVGKTRALEEAIRNRVGDKVRGVRRVRIRFVTDRTGEPDPMEEFISPSVSARSSPEPEEHSHDNEHGSKPHGHHQHEADGGLFKRK